MPLLTVSRRSVMGRAFLELLQSWLGWELAQNMHETLRLHIRQVKEAAWDGSRGRDVFHCVRGAVDGGGRHVQIHTS